MGIIEDVARGIVELVSSVARISVQPVEGGPGDAVPRKIYPRMPVHEPLIDVIREGRTIRVVAILPGIRREDVWYEVGEGVIAVEVTGFGMVFRREIRCRVRPERISVMSESENNSVVEIVFEKKAPKRVLRRKGVKKAVRNGWHDGQELPPSKL